MNLLDNFINSLHQKISKRSQLVLYIADVLCIERESANRRLNGKVQFTIEEMEKLSLKLGISLDNLMYKKHESILPPLKIKTLMSGYSMEDLIIAMEDNAKKFKSISGKPIEFGTAFSSLPLEFILPYPYIEKFMFYKWGYFYAGSNEYNDFSLWEVPERLKEINQKLIRVCADYKSAIYIWNPVTLWSMANEIKYFKIIHAINEQDIDNIKAELHEMINAIENTAKMQSDNKIEIYASFINHGLNIYYFITESSSYVTYDSYFFSLDNQDNYLLDINIKEWLNSIKKASTLISGSGARERSLFFQEQHKHISEI